MTRLQYLFLRNSSVLKIKSNAFTNLTRLKCVHLLLNHIDTIEEDAFKGITNQVAFQIDRVYPPPLVSNFSLSSLVNELCYLRKSSDIFIKRKINKVVYYQSMNLVIAKQDWEQLTRALGTMPNSRLSSGIDDECSFKIFIMRFARNLIPAIETEFEYLKFIEVCYQAKLDSHKYMSC